MKTIVYLSSIILIFTTGCSGNSGGGGADAAVSSQAKPYIDGDWYFLTRTYKATADTLIIAARFQGTVFNTISIRVPSGAGTAVYRKSIGTVLNSGDMFTINYSYETCNPVHTEKFKITSTDPADSIFVTQEGSADTIIFRDDKKYTLSGVNLNNLTIMTEDKNCTLMQ